MAHPVPIWGHGSLKTKYSTYLGYKRELLVIKTKKQESVIRNNQLLTFPSLYILQFLYLLYKTTKDRVQQTSYKQFYSFTSTMYFFKNHTYTSCIFILFYSTPTRIQSAGIIYITVNLKKRLNVCLSGKEYCYTKASGSYLEEV